MIINEPEFKVIRRSHKFYLPRSFVVVKEMILEYKNNMIVVPMGTITDFASIPWWARWLIYVNGDHRLCALMHDYMYECGGIIETFSYTRKDADIAFLEMCHDEGVPSWQSLIMYYSLRLAGQKRYGKIN